MADEQSFSRAFQSFARRENLPAALTSDEWESVPNEIRERSFFMARVNDAEILQKFRDEADNVLRGEIDEVGAEKRIHMWLQEAGYKPPEGKAGTIQDLSSLERINLVLRTNVAMARGHAVWIAGQLGIRVAPVRELVRISERKEPRDWPTIWDEARGELADIPGVHPTKMMALLNHPIWRKISRFGNPYPPFDFNSGMGLKIIKRKDALANGFKLDPNNDPMQQPQARSMNEELEVTPQVKDGDINKALDDKLGRFGKRVDNKIEFTDPNGTKKYTAPELAEVWAKPAPKGFDALHQKEALDKWTGGREPEKQADRVQLRRLFDRIETPEQPETLWRAVTITARQFAAIIRGLQSRVMSVPGTVSGWDWSRSKSDAAAIAGTPDTGWQVIMRVSGVRRSVDISALRMGKPGHVYVGGTEFSVRDYKSDPSAQTITMELEEL